MSAKRGMGRRTEKIFGDGEDDPQAEMAWDEEDVVGEFNGGHGGIGTQRKRKKANTTERSDNIGDCSGVAVAAAKRSSPSSNTNAAMKVDPRERHKLAERERRKSMRELFLSLHALLPNGDVVRKEQSAILDEIIKYIPLAAFRLRSLRIDAQPRRRTSRRKDKSIDDLEIPEAAGGNSPNYTATPSSSCSSLSLSSYSSSSGTTTTALTPTITNMKHPRESSSAVAYYACNSRSGSSNSLNSLATGSPSSGCSRKTGAPSTTPLLPDDCCAVDIRLAPEPATSVSIRLRGDRVNVSLTDHSYVKQATPPASWTTQPVLILSAVLDELEAHGFEVIRSTHCRDGLKLLHYSESKIQANHDQIDGSVQPISMEALQRRLHHLASKLQTLRKTTITIPTSASTY